MIEIPVSADPHFEQRMTLDGEYYTLRFRWNERTAQWKLHVGDGDGNPVAHGIALVANNWAGMHVRYLAGMPPGAFALLDTTGRGVDPGFDELGQRVVVMYVTEAELA